MYFALIFLLIIALPLVVMPKDISAGEKSPYRIVINGVIAVSAGAAVVFMAASLTGSGLFSRIMEDVKDAAGALATDARIAEAFRMTDETVAERKEFLTAAYESVIKLAPFYIMALGAIISYIEYIILSRSLGKRSAVKKMPPFREFSFPPGTVMALVAMYFIAWIMTTSETVDSDMLYLNVSAMFDFAFCIQGISVIFMFFHMKRIHKAAPVAVSVALWITFIGQNILLIMGMVDMIMNLKLIIQMKNSR